MTPSQTVELRPSSPRAVKIVCYIYRLSVGDKAWQAVTPSVTQHRMSSVFWRGIVGQHKSFFFLFFFFFFFDTWISALSNERGCGFNWTLVCFVAFAEGIFLRCLRVKTLMRLKAHTREKFPKNNLEITTKIRTSQIKYAIFKISKIFFIFIETFLYLATEHYTLFGYQNFQAYPRGHEGCWKICSPTVLPINASSHSFCLIVYKCNTIKLFKEAKRAFTFSENNNC